MRVYNNNYLNLNNKNKKVNYLKPQSKNLSSGFLLLSDFVSCV